MSDAHRDEIAKLESLYQENPEGRIFAHLADAYRKDGAFDRAHQVLSDGLDRHPDYSSAHVVRGRVLMDQGRAEEAEAAFRRVLDLDPHNLIAIRCLGDLARSRGDDEEALDYFHRLLEQEPGEEEVREIVDAMTGGRGAEEEAPTVELGQEVVAEVEGDFGAEGELGAEDELGGRRDDWTAAAAGAGAEEPSAGAEEPGEPDFSLIEEIEEEPAGRGSAEEEPEDAGLRTETIAQVYARQGLYDRAADVYRELSLSRPDDEGLRERLAEMEELASAQTARSGEIDAVSDFAPEEAGPLQGLESTEPGLEPEEAEPEPMELEGFQGGELDTTGVEAEALPGLEPQESDPETGLRGDVTPDTAEPEEDLSGELDVQDVPEPPEEMPWAEEPAVKDSEPDWLVEALAVEEEPAAETPHAWTDEEEDVDSSPPIRDYLSSLLTWPEAEAGAAEPAVEPAGPGAPAEAERGPEAAGRPSAPESPEDDDDLDMFRSWLESLKQ